MHWVRQYDTLATLGKKRSLTHTEKSVSHAYMDYAADELMREGETERALNKMKTKPKAKASTAASQIDNRVVLRVLSAFLPAVVVA